MGKSVVSCFLDTQFATTYYYSLPEKNQLLQLILNL